VGNTQHICLLQVLFSSYEPVKDRQTNRQHT